MLFEVQIDFVKERRLSFSGGEWGEFTHIPWEIAIFKDGERVPIAALTSIGSTVSVNAKRKTIPMIFNDLVQRLIENLNG